jgi:hypothetical protein
MIYVPELQSVAVIAAMAIRRSSNSLAVVVSGNRQYNLRNAA